ncbi:MAG: hypothetical protein IPN34_21005 [Planctomycetes bacterium]|nr:hypothetical protein [Planctomycetota bacterium]
MLEGILDPARLAPVVGAIKRTAAVGTAPRSHALELGEILILEKLAELGEERVMRHDPRVSRVVVNPRDNRPRRVASSSRATSCQNLDDREPEGGVDPSTSGSGLSGELDHSAAAKELGLTPGVWGLWRARHAKGQGKKPVARKAAKKDARGRRADPAETARRVSMLERVQAGEVNNAAAAKDQGIKVGAWGAWKSGYLKRSGGGAKKRGSPPGRITTRASAATDGLAGVIAQLDGLRRFGEELRERISAIVELVEQKFPGR